MNDRSTFRGTVRFWRPEQQGGLAVVDIPAEVASDLGGLKQMRVSVSIAGTEFTSNTMPAGGGRLALSVSRKMLDAVGLHVGDEAEFEIARLVPPPVEAPPG
jgi:antitoxin component of MazEF toxin-antitoxin module